MRDALDDENASVLVLMPVAVLVFIVLGALCVDFGSAFTAKRELSNAAAAAANDVVSEALDVDHFYATGEVRLRPEVARAVAERSLAAEDLGRLDAVVDDVSVAADGFTVTVRVRGRAHYLFAKALPGGPEGVDVTASSTAHPAEVGR